MGTAELFDLHLIVRKLSNRKDFFLQAFPVEFSVCHGVVIKAKKLFLSVYLELASTCDNPGRVKDVKTFVLAVIDSRYLKVHAEPLDDIGMVAGEFPGREDKILCRTFSDLNELACIPIRHVRSRSVRIIGFSIIYRNDPHMLDGAGLDLVQRLLQVSDQVVHVLQAKRDADQIVHHADRAAVVLGVIEE